MSCRVEKTALVNVPFKECLLFGSSGDASVRNPDSNVTGVRAKEALDRPHKKKNISEPCACDATLDESRFAANIFVSLLENNFAFLVRR